MKHPIRLARSKLIPLFGLALAGATCEAAARYLNTTAGGELRPGVYGRIEFGKQPAPAVIYDKPLVGSQALLPADTRPIYLYVPPGQVRKWSRHCGKYQACDLPVYFVRMDNSPSKLGKWKARSDFSGRRDAEMALRSMGGPPGIRD